MKRMRRIGEGKAVKNRDVSAFCALFGSYGQRIFATLLQIGRGRGIISLRHKKGMPRTRENGMVSSELRAVLGDVYEKTGVEVFLEPQGGEETEFDFVIAGGAVKGYLRGTGEETEKLAKLVAYHVAACERQPFLGKREELRSVLTGADGSWRAYRFMNNFGIADGTCYALEVVCDRLPAEALFHIERCVNEDRDDAVPMDEGRIAVVRFSGEEGSPYEFASFLSQSLYEELGVRASIGVGCDVKSFREIASSYAQAVTAVRMSTLFHGEGEVHTYREYLLVRMIGDVPKSRLKDYMEQFRIGGAEIFGDAEMVQTAEAFLACSLNISETSRTLYLHRNTLIYRLDKIERATGLNIRKFSDAVTFRVITILYKLLQT